MDIELFGDNLRLVRLGLGYSQEQAAELCGISEKTLGKIERGQTNFSVEIINRIEAAFSLKLTDLIEGKADPRRGPYEYYPILESCNLPDGTAPYTYGIILCQNVSARLYLLTVAHDVSTLPGLVMEQVNRFNAGQLSPLHLMDVIQDMLP